MGERIEGRSVVDEIDRQPTAPPTERDRDTCRSVAMCHDIGEELFEDDEKPRPFIVGEATITSECLGKGLEFG